MTHLLLTGEAGQVRRDVISASETRDCEQCGAVFTRRREHARFCSCSCRDSWNRERGRDAATGTRHNQSSLVTMRP
jgi:hypothetical protein